MRDFHMFHHQSRGASSDPTWMSGPELSENRGSSILLVKGGRARWAKCGQDRLEVHISGKANFW